MVDGRRAGDTQSLNGSLDQSAYRIGRSRNGPCRFKGQADALGQIAGGPVVGAVGLLSSVRVALSLSALLLLPIIPVFRGAMNAERKPPLDPGLAQGESGTCSYRCRAL